MPNEVVEDRLADMRRSFEARRRAFLATWSGRCPACGATVTADGDGHRVEIVERYGGNPLFDAFVVQCDAAGKGTER